MVALVSGCASRVPWGAARETATTNAARRIDVEVTSHGFVPDHIAARRGEIIALVFTRTVERSCADRVILSLDEDRRIEHDLPLRRPITVTLVMERRGELGFSCPMGMYGGTVEVR